MKAITPITISTNRRTPLSLAGGKRAIRCACAGHRANAICITLPRRTAPRPNARTRHDVPHNSAGCAVIYDVCPIADRANLIVPNCDKLWLFLRNLTLNMYYEFHFMFTVYGRSNSMNSFPPRRNSYSVALQLVSIIRTSADIYWHSMSLREFESFVRKTRESRKSSGLTPPAVDKGL